MPDNDTIKSTFLAPPMLGPELQARLDAAADCQNRGMLDEATACYLQVIMAAADNVHAWIGLAR
jgi:hypothetical protein